MVLDETRLEVLLEARAAAVGRLHSVGGTVGWVVVPDARCVCLGEIGRAAGSQRSESAALSVELGRDGLSSCGREGWPFEGDVDGQ